MPNSPKLPTLNQEQERFLELVQEGKNIFLTGKAGSGKSTVIKALLSKFKNSQSVAHAAPTGIAAQNIKGVTLHRLFWIPIGLIPKEWKPKKDGFPNALKKIDLLVIDECSMIRVDVFEAIDKVLRMAKNEDKPFGGVQLILVGDLYQLPPVIKQDEQEYFEKEFGGGYFFLSEIYKELECITYPLKEIHRQDDDHFLEILNGIREGSDLHTTLANLNRSVGEPHPKATILSGTNATASATNKASLQKIRAPIFEYHAMADGKVNAGDVPCERTVSLKTGARVIMIVNGDDYVNGDTGTVTSLDDEFIRVQLDKGEEIEVGFYKWNVRRPKFNSNSGQLEYEIIGWVEQVPIKLGWACTIHKSQGLTLDHVHINLGNSGGFAHGQIYVALSRCRSLEGLSLEKEISARDVIVDPLVTEFHAGASK